METPETTQRSLILLPPTKEQRMLRIKEAWEKIGQDEQTNSIEVDAKRATLLAEALEEETRDGKIEQKDFVQEIGLSQPYVSQLLLYYDFRSFCISMNIDASIFNIPIFRFLAYWKQMSDPQETRKRDPERKKAYRRRVFLGIVEWLEAGKAPTKRPKPKENPTVEQMFTKKKPLAAFRKEVDRLYQQDLAPLVAKSKEYFGRDRATYAPDFMAQAMMDLEQWHKNLMKLMSDFDNYVQQ